MGDVSPELTHENRGAGYCLPLSKTRQALLKALINEKATVYKQAVAGMIATGIAHEVHSNSFEIRAIAPAPCRNSRQNGVGEFLISIVVRGHRGLDVPV